MVKVLVLGPAFQVEILKRIFRSGMITPNVELKFFPRGSNIISNLSKFLELLISIQKYDVVHALYPSHKTTFKTILHSVKNNKRAILHWIGSDVLLAEKRKLHEKYVDIFYRTINIAVAPWIKKELEGIDIPVHYVIPLVPPELLYNKPLPLPDKFTVLYYLPSDKPEIYRPDIVELIARKFKDIKVIVVGGGKTPKLPNIVNLGKIPRNKMREIYKNTTVLVRFTTHDGMPLMVFEALSYGRYVMYNRPVPYVIYVRNEHDILTHLNTLIEMRDLKHNIVNLPDIFLPQIIMKKLLQIYLT